jgi:hypothetical protein
LGQAIGVKYTTQEQPTDVRTSHPSVFSIS